MGYAICSTVLWSCHKLTSQLFFRPCEILLHDLCNYTTGCPFSSDCDYLGGRMRLTCWIFQMLVAFPIVAVTDGYIVFSVLMSIFKFAFNFYFDWLSWAKLWSSYPSADVSENVPLINKSKTQTTEEWKG